MGIPPEAAPAPAVAATRFLFGKERRIRKRGEFLRVQQTGLRATSPHFVLLVAAGPDAKAPSRLGIVATKKVGDATMRNRIKRLCRECFRLWPGFVPDGVDVVVIAREGADALTLEKVRKEWERARGAVLANCKKVLAASLVAGTSGAGSGKTARPGARGSADSSARASSARPAKAKRTEK